MTRFPCNPNPGESPITPERCAQIQSAFYFDRPGTSRTCVKSCHYYCAPATHGDARLTESIVADAAKDRAKHREEVDGAYRYPRVIPRELNSVVR